MRSSSPGHGSHLQPYRVILLAALAAAAGCSRGATDLGPQTPAYRVSWQPLHERSDTQRVWIAHRGFRTWPENTIESINGSFAAGAHAVEVDIRMSRDGVPFLMHDTTVDRTTDGTGVMRDLAADSLRRLDACGKLSAGLLHCSVPTLHQAILAGRNKGPILLDLSHKSTSDLVRILRDVLSLGARDLVMYTSSEPETLVRLAALDPRAHFALVSYQAVGPDSVRSLGAAGLLLDQAVALADTSLVRRYRERHLPLGWFTVTAKTDYRVWQGAGASWLVSDIARR